MGGVLYSGINGRHGVEASGVYEGILKEDMIDTIQRVKKFFIDVYIDTLFFEDADYPLTFVPMYNSVLPLKKDQKVWVYFNQENYRYPVLWKLSGDLGDSDYLNNFRLPNSTNLVSFPNSEDTAEVHKFSDSFWFIGTKSYGLFHWGQQSLLFNDNNITIHASGNVNVKADNVNIDSNKAVINGNLEVTK